jgi:hypothetical protein
MERVKFFLRSCDNTLGHIEDVEALEAENKKLKAQLPEQMQECTIRFKECEAGHGWLTADNWIDHSCFICENQKLKAVLVGIDEYLDTGTNETAIYQGSKGHKKIKEVLGE